MNCRQCEDMFVDGLYSELDQESQSRFEDHIGSCSKCRDAYVQLQSTLGVMDRYQRTDPGQAFWDGYWNRLAARMEREDEAGARERNWLSRLLPGWSTTGARWAYGSALALALIVFGVIVGRVMVPGPGGDRVVVTESAVDEGPTVARETGGNRAEIPRSESKSGAPPTRMASAEACAHQYIEDSQVLLLALVNFDPETEGEYLADWSPEKRRSRELIAQAGSLKNELSDPKHRRLRELVTELEMILIQIANLESTGDVEAVDLIRSSVNDQDMMFKIDLEKIRSSENEKPEPGACDA